MTATCSPTEAHAGVFGAVTTKISRLLIQVMPTHDRARRGDDGDPYDMCEGVIRWLQCACILVGVTGLIAAGGSHELTQEPWRLLFDLLAWPLDGHPSELSDDGAAVSAISGGLMVGWAVLMYAVVSGPVARGDRAMTDALMVAVTAWFIVDSTGSIAADLPGNLVLNGGFWLAFVVPLGRLRRAAALRPTR